MAKLLHVEASPRKERSASIAVANAFLDAYREAHPDDEVETWDLWAEPLPEFDGDTLNGKYAIMHGQEHTPEQAAAWQAVESAFERFASADKYVLSSPMWNFGIPYKLKHFVDVVTQPGLSFSFDPETGYTGLVTGKPIALVLARGGSYGDEQTAALDLQKAYLDLWLGFIGFEKVEHVLVEPTIGAPDDVAAVKAAATERATAVAAGF